MSATDAKNSLNMGNAPGPALKSSLGTSLQRSNFDHEAQHRDSVKSYAGTVIDIRLQLEKAPKDGLAGTRVKLRFDSSAMNVTYGDYWFRLTNDTVSMLHQYGTKEAIISSGLRVVLKTMGMSIRAGEATIVGDSKQEEVFTDFDKTPVFAWADITGGALGGIG